MAFPRPGVAISSRAFSRMLDSDIQFPRFVDFVVEKEKNERKRERERERERERSKLSYDACCCCTACILSTKCKEKQTTNIKLFRSLRKTSLEVLNIRGRIIAYLFFGEREKS